LRKHKHDVHPGQSQASKKAFTDAEEVHQFIVENVAPADEEQEVNLDPTFTGTAQDVIKTLGQRKLLLLENLDEGDEIEGTIIVVDYVAPKDPFYDQLGKFWEKHVNDSNHVIDFGQSIKDWTDSDEDSAEEEEEDPWIALVRFNTHCVNF
jgi:hypothetical protein